MKNKALVWRLDWAAELTAEKKAVWWLSSGKMERTVNFPFCIFFVRLHAKRAGCGIPHILHSFFFWKKGIETVFPTPHKNVTVYIHVGLFWLLIFFANPPKAKQYRSLTWLALAISCYCINVAQPSCFCELRSQEVESHCFYAAEPNI